MTLSLLSSQRLMYLPGCCCHPHVFVNGFAVLIPVWSKAKENAPSPNIESLGAGKIGDKAAYCQDWWSEFDPWDSLVGGENWVSQAVFWPPHVLCVIFAPINTIKKIQLRLSSLLGDSLDEFVRHLEYFKTLPVSYLSVSRYFYSRLSVFCLIPFLGNRCILSEL